MKPKTGKNQNKSIATRSLGSRSTSCEKEDWFEGNSKLIASRYDSKSPSFKSILRKNRDHEDGTGEVNMMRIETVEEEDEQPDNEKQSTHSQSNFKSRLHIVEDLVESRGADSGRFGKRNVGFEFTRTGDHEALNCRYFQK